MSSSDQLQPTIGGAAAIDAYRRRGVELLDSLDVDSVASAVDTLIDCWRRGGLVALAGNGGSASTASHIANDLVKATRVPGKPAFRAVALTDNASVLTALGNDDGFETVFATQLNSVLTRGDVFVVISASGNSPNVVIAARRAHELGGRVVALTGFDGGELAQIADDHVHVPTERGEYGPVEDIHLVLGHMITGCLHARIEAEVL